MGYISLQQPRSVFVLLLLAVVSLPSGSLTFVQRFPPAADDDFDQDDTSRTKIDGPRPRFNHMVLDPSTKSIYVGAINHLYRLDTDRLAVIGSRSIGPRLDDRRCTESFGVDRCGAGGSTAYVARPTDNFVKVLTVDPSRRRLVVCGSTFQGTCELLDLDIGLSHHGDHSSSSPLSGNGIDATPPPRPTRGNTDYFVAANDPDLSTVGFVAPGPGGQMILYVAATYSGSASVLTAISSSTGTSGSGSSVSSSIPLSSSSSSSSSSSAAAAAAVSAVRQAVPAVSSRSLVPGPGAFRFVHVDGLTGGTALRFRSEAIERFSVEYVSGFDGGDGFSYFVTVQPESFEMSGSGILPPIVSNEMGSRIIQVCQNDRNYYSYIEMPIRCRSTETDFNIIRSAIIARPGHELTRQLGLDRLNERIVVAVFSTGREDEPDGAGGQRDSSGTGSWSSATVSSAVCVYPLSEIRARFTRNIQRCFAAEQRHVGLQFGNRMCVSLGMQINSSYCGEVEQNGPLVGTIPVEVSPSLVFPDVQLTAVVTSTVEDQTVAFLGTSDGHLKKVVLLSNGESYEFHDSIVVDGSTVNKDLLLDFNETHVFVMTESQVTKMAVAECEFYQTCESCRGARNPYCGWCSLEKRCSMKFSCLDSHQDKRWLSASAWECIRIPPQFVNPVSIGIKRSVQVSVGIKALPVLGDMDKYLCVFGANWSVSAGTVSPNEIKCWTPPPQMFLPLFQSHSNDHINMTLSIRSTRTSVDFIDTTLTFFDCSKHSTCSVCTQSPWGCSWCVHRSQCLQTEDTANCRTQIIKDPESCPRLKHDAGSHHQFLLPVGVLKEIHLRAVNLPTTKNSDRGYECLVHLASPPLQIPARRESPTSIVCEAFAYWYEAEEPQKTASLEVAVNGRYLLEDSYGISVTLFKCDVMAPDCSTCLSLQEAPHSARFSCLWCGDRCQHNSTCDRNMIPMSTKCPMPVIESVYPLTGLVDGGIRVTIKGLNLGTNFDHVRHSVTVAGVSCEVIASEYIVSRQIVCKTGPMGTLQQGAVIVNVGDALVSSDSPFKYQNLQVTSVYPTIGPRAGGTEVTFTGHDLDTGSNVQVLFDYISCSVDRKRMNQTYFVCITTPVSDPTLLPVAIRIDDAVVQLNDEFEYSENPVITSIEPLSAFKSGGRVITVTGSFLNSVRQPIMHLYNHGHRFSSNCKPIDDVTLRCPSPQVSSRSRNNAAKRSPSTTGGGVTSSSTSHEYTVGFTMDDVETVRDLPLYFPDVRSTFTVHADPTYDQFRNGKKVYKGEALILTGTHLNAASDVDEVFVWIGNSSCKVNSIDSKTLYCLPPAVQPPGLSESGRWDKRVLPLVRVAVGRLEFVLGQLEYQKFELARSEYWVVGVAVGGGVLLTVVMVILIVYKRKSTHAQRQFRRLQQQLDSLESNIRNECKQAFAELQTEVTDFTSDLNGIGIPFCDYRSYTLHVFFPTGGDTDHIMYCDAKLSSSISNNCCGAINKFYQLLGNDCFLLCFIRVLDGQQNFSIRHKSKVASLVMTVFHNKMDYLTIILKVLLGDLIDRSLERKQPKLMLRRTEFIVEKLLTNWLSLCMYGYMKKRIATALFMLYKAIKHQVDKGPVDAVTFEARYALSEDRLLREKIESKPLTIYLISEVGVHEPGVCKMLDCDTINQAKEKALDAIFKNTPYSQRPSLADVDLELLSPSGGRLLLRDDDSTTVVMRHNERRLNTLGHYHVTDRSTIAIVKARLHRNGFHDDFKKSTLRKASPVIASTDSGSKFIHLVKHDDGHHMGRDQKVMSEIFLTRLLATKCTLQQYVDDLFTAILEVDAGGPPPIAVKYLFDFFDAAVRRHGISDPEVVHTWKSNSLLLRFWVNIVKNPEFVFDVHKSHVVDSCLSVVAQTFMDSCSIQEQRLGKDSPSSKLLYAKDIPRYRQLVMQFYRDVQDMPPVSDAQIADFLVQQSESYPVDFQIDVGLLELMKFARQYKYEVLEMLDDDSEARQQQLAARFEDVMSTVEDALLC